MSRRRAGLSFRRQRRKFNLPLFKEIVSWVVELIVVIGLAYVLVSIFRYTYKCGGPGYGADIGER